MSKRKKIEKRDKLKKALEEKIESLKNKIKKLKDSEKKQNLKKQLNILKEFLQKIDQV